MLTELVEKNRIKADKYWPEAVGETVNYGPMHIHFQKCTHRGKKKIITVRFFQIWKDPDYNSSDDDVSFSGSEFGDSVGSDDEIRHQFGVRSYRLKRRLALLYIQLQHFRSFYFCYRDGIHRVPKVLTSKTTTFTRTLRFRRPIPIRRRTPSSFRKMPTSSFNFIIKIGQVRSNLRRVTSISCPSFKFLMLPIVDQITECRRIHLI